MSLIASASSDTRDSTDTHKSQRARRTRSTVWEHYEPNLLNVDGELRAVCKYCGLNLSTKSGTSSLRSHISNSCPAIDDSIRNRFQAAISKQPLVGNFIFDPQACHEEMINYIMHAEIPFLKFEDPYLQRWLRKLQPTFKVKGRQTIRNDCFKKYHELRKELQIELRSLNSRVCLTSDIWTSSQDLGYMAVTAHYIDAEFNIKKKIIWFKGLEYPHSGIAIQEELMRCLAEWGIREKVFTLTVDNASNNTTACELLVTDCKPDLMLGGEHLHVRCCAHILNILVQDGMRLIHSSIHRIRELLKHIDSSPSRLQEFNSIANGKGLRSKSGVYLDVQTRWNSTYKMLREAWAYRTVLNTYAVKYYEIPLSEEEWAKAGALCEFLRAFEELTLSVSAHREPTSHKFLPSILCVQHALKDPAWQSTDLLKELAAAMSSKFEKYWDPDEDYLLDVETPRRKTKEIAFNQALVIATLLDPRRKTFFVEFFFEKVCRSANQIRTRANSAVDWMRRYFTHYEKQRPRTGIMDLTTCDSEVSTIGSPVLGKRKLEAEFAQYVSRRMVEESPKSEIDTYLCERNEADIKGFDVLAWWKSKAEKYPVLSVMARDFLAIPLSTVASESAFSCGKRILGEHRSSLTPEMLEALVCGKDWLFMTMDVDSEGEDLDSETQEE